MSESYDDHVDLHPPHAGAAASSRSVIAAKICVLAGFLSLVVCTYYLRSEVLALSHIKFSANELLATSELEQLRESYPDRVQQYQAAMEHYQLQLTHYREMLALYKSNYEEYVRRIEDEYVVPPQPQPPNPPSDPQLASQLYEINAEFRARKNRYFAVSSRLNWLACGAAILLVGGLLYLLMFDYRATRWHYLAALVLSFVFLIGPAFHSILTGVIGFLEDPPLR